MEDADVRGPIGKYLPLRASIMALGNGWYTELKAPATELTTNAAHDAASYSCWVWLRVVVLGQMNLGAAREWAVGIAEPGRVP